ncbi:hypothetical protein [Pseudoalteromonas sp. TAE80]|nr:hypothetical protein [Pseudoalteromonas sp. TAE80]
MGLLAIFGETNYNDLPHCSKATEKEQQARVFMRASASVYS